jgi:nucleotide-binding universal stress UspA family protein
MKQPILVPTDLTDVASKAIRQAAVIAKKGNTSLVLLHVLNEKSPSREEAAARMQKDAQHVKELFGIDCEILFREGNIFDEIPQVDCEKCYDMVVIGTHGKHGLKQHLMGAYILKLVNLLKTPALVIQEESSLLENFSSLLMPVSSHAGFHRNIEAVMTMARIFGAEIHLYSVHKPGYDWPPQLLKNIEDARIAFETNGIRFQRVKEEQTVFSQGYAKQTLLYSQTHGTGMISLMSSPSEDYYYFATADKEALMLNELHLPVLCIS